MLNFPRTERSDMVDAFLYASVNIISSRHHPKHPTREYRVIYKAHPLVIRLCWALRRWIRIKPWVEAWYPDDADAFYIRSRNTMVVGERTYRMMKSVSI